MNDRRARLTTLLLGAVLAVSGCAGPSVVPSPSPAASARREIDLSVDQKPVAGTSGTITGDGRCGVGWGDAAA
jgi:hypothetical protein